MSIFPLPVFEADADPARRDALTDEEAYARLRPPATIVVRFGAMRMIGEFPYEGDAKPGCGTKLVVRTPRGTELAEMLTTTCSNSGCSKTVSRQEMLEYIENSGGRDYPFHDHGRVLRIASTEDLQRWSQLQAGKLDLLKRTRAIAARSGPSAPAGGVEVAEGPPEPAFGAAPAAAMKIVDVEPILGGEMLTVYYLSEERVDFRDLVRELAREFATRIEMRHVGARDEARLVADYERCGQHCCCKGFLKVLKPVSMKSAKIQKATLDPLKISGRCGRLMCCLRYEDQTYEQLKAKLPKLKSRVGTSEGPGFVVETRILVQLVLVQLEHDGREIAVPVEELLDPALCPPPGSTAAPTTRLGPSRSPDRGAGARPGSQPRRDDPLRGLSPEQVQARLARDGRGSNEPEASSPTRAAPAAGSQAKPSDRPRRDDRRFRRPKPQDAAPGGAEGAAHSPPTSAPSPAAPRSTQEQQDRFRAEAQRRERDGAAPKPDHPRPDHPRPDQPRPAAASDPRPGGPGGEAPQGAGKKRRRRRRGGKDRNDGDPGSEAT